MTRVQLEQLIDRVRKPHNLRVLILVAIQQGIIWIGILAMPSLPTPSERRMWFVSRVFSALIIITAIGLAHIFRAASSPLIKPLRAASGLAAV